MDKLLKYNGVQEALKFLREDDERTLQEHLEMCWEPGKGLGMDRESWLRDIQTLFSKGRQTLL